MFVEMNRSSAMSIFILGIVITLVMERYIYGIMMIIWSALIAFQYMILHSGSTKLLKYSPITQVPVFIYGLIVSLTSFYILVKSRETDIVRKWGSTIPFVIFIGLSVAIYLLKSQPLLQRDFMKFIPLLFLMMFFLMVALVKDNQIILMNWYKDTKQRLETL